MSNKQRPEIDGGKVALSGFYFQFWVSFADNITKALLENVSDPKDLLFGYEYKDADNVQLTGGVARIIQVKFSAVLDPIQPSEAKKIFVTMQKFANKQFPVASGWKREFILRTNRTKSPEYHETIEANYANSAPALMQFLRNGWVITTLEDCYKVIEEWGRDFGMTGTCDEGEVRSGAGRVLLRLEKGVVQGNNWLTREELEELFVGYPKPFRLNPKYWDNNAEPRQTVQKGGQEFCEDINTPEDDHYINRRKQLRDMSSAIESHPIVILQGEGGNGKSVLLGQFASEWANSGYVAGVQAIDLDGNWLSQCISRWRHNPEPTGEHISVALGRLVGASIGLNTQKAIFVIDGVDETSSDSNLRYLVNQFCNLDSNVQRSTTIVFVCRKAEDIDIFERMLDRRDVCKVLTVSKFEVSELKNFIANSSELFSQKVNCKLLAALENALNPVTEKDFPFPFRDRHDINHDHNDITETVSDRYTELNDPSYDLGSIIDMLRHPVVWRIFTKNLEDHQRLGILINQEDCWDCVAEKMLRWFGAKFRKRANGRFPEAENRAIDVLKNVVQKCPSTGKTYTRNDWISAMRNVPYVDDVFSHAISSGLVDGKNDPLKLSTWNWRYPFIPQYLLRVIANEEVRTNEI